MVCLFDKAIRDPKSYSKDFHIFLIFEKDKWKEDILKNLDNIQVELPNLTLNVVLINSLKDLIKETYSLVPEVTEEVVYCEQEWLFNDKRKRVKRYLREGYQTNELY